VRVMAHTWFPALLYRVNVGGNGLGGAVGLGLIHWL
jgi:hypothetical protein